MPDSVAPVALGKWSRVMTFGHKVQEQPDGEGGTVAVPFDFTPETCGQIVGNFARLYSARRLGLDYNHLGADPAAPVPVQHLAFFSGLAVIADGQVATLWDHDPARQAPDPAALLLEIQQKYPREIDADGLWAYCCEVTPLGAEVLPNMQDLSPYFLSDDVDEQNNPIGYRLMNISAVSVGFQDKTTLSLSKGRMDLSASVGHTSGPTKGVSQMADEKNKEAAAGGLSPEMRKMAMEKFGLPDGMTDGEIMAHVMAKLGDEGAGPAGEMSDEDYYKMSGIKPGCSMAEADAMMAKFMAGDGDADDKAKMSAKHGKMRATFGGPLPQEAAEGAQMAKEQREAMLVLSKQVAAQQAQLAKIQAERAEIAATEKATREADGYIAEGRWPADRRDNLIKLCKAGLGKESVEPFARGSFTLSRTQFGAAPASAQSASGTTWERRGNLPVKGAALSKAASALAAKEKIDFGEAQLRIAREHPELYQN